MNSTTGHDLEKEKAPGRLQSWAASLKQSVSALYLAGRHPRVPTVAKIIITLTVAYALSPIDLIPDAIPLIGYLDDLLIVPIGVWLALRLIPEPVWQECLQRAMDEPPNLKENRTAAVVIVLIWIVTTAALGVWLYRLFAAAEP